MLFICSFLHTDTPPHTHPTEGRKRGRKVEKRNREETKKGPRLHSWVWFILQEEGFFGPTIQSFLPLSRHSLTVPCLTSVQPEMRCDPLERGPGREGLVEGCGSTVTLLESPESHPHPCPLTPQGEMRRTRAAPAFPCQDRQAQHEKENLQLRKCVECKAEK